MHQKASLFRINIMRLEYKKSINPPDNLLPRIMARIGREKRLLAIKRVILFSFGIILPLAAFFPILRLLVADISSSGLTQYLSLVFSDTGAIMASWSDYLLSIAESLPVVPITGLLIIIFVFLGSLRLAAKGLAELNPGQHRFLNS
jgi:hypothetical protein